MVVVLFLIEYSFNFNTDDYIDDLAYPANYYAYKATPKPFNPECNRASRGVWY